MSRFSGPLLLILALVGLPAAALDVDVELHGRYDLAAFETWAWRPGVAAKSRLVEEIIRETVEAQMVAEGLELVEGEADCYLATFVTRDTKYPAGVLKVDIIDAESAQLAWRGLAYGVVSTGKEQKIRKKFEKAIRRMFGEFPVAPYF